LQLSLYDLLRLLRPQPLAGQGVDFELILHPDFQTHNL